MGIIFDLDQTLIDSSSVESLRRARNWSQVYPRIPDLPVFDGISDLLTELAGRYMLGVVTSSPRPYCSRVIDHHKWPIRHTVCFHDTNRRKPHPDPISKAVELMKMEASQVMSIGDDPKDIVASNAAGVISVAVTWGAADRQALAESGPDVLFDTVHELREYLFDVD